MVFVEVILVRFNMEIHIKDIGVLLRVRQRFWCIQDQIAPISLYLLPIIQILPVTVGWDCLKLGELLNPYILKNSSLSIFVVLQSNYKIWRFDLTTKRNAGINQGRFNKGLYYCIQTRALETKRSHGFYHEEAQSQQSTI